MSFPPARLMATAVIAWAAVAAPAMAQLPAGGVVARGSATITQTANGLIVNQTSNKALYLWNQYSIGRGFSVQYDEPGAGSIALNRVVGGGGPSYLFGTLSANGQVWLINPAGIVVGSGASITAAGVLLSTADINDDDFFNSNGHYKFSIAGNTGARIVNYGAISAASGGAVVLAADRVKNGGTIEADMGSVVLAGARTYAVDFNGDGLLRFAIKGAVDGVTGQAPLVDNAGTIAAAGGKVRLTADAAKGVLDNVINSSGIIEATSVANVDGKIVLSGEGGSTTVSGTLDASGKGTGQTGGTVEVLGDNEGDSVTLTSTARVDVSGDAGGGTALIGGNFRGQGRQPHAATTTVSSGALIDADAITSGNGGNVAVWSDVATNMLGTITATGGAQGGNGGYVETSTGGSILNLDGANVQVGAANGARGLWLLDPEALTIDSTLASEIEGTLATGDVVIESTASGASTVPALSIPGGDESAATFGTIIVNASITWSSVSQLSLLAQGAITVNDSIQATGNGNLNLVAGWDGSTGLSGGVFNVATVLATPSSYGNNNAAVTIGNGLQTGLVAVGSFAGTTTVAANSLSLSGSATTSNAGAMLGYSNNTESTATGAIQVALHGALTLTGGGNDSTITADFAQIGDGGEYSESSNDATITISAGNVTLTAGAGDDSYAQIGNGGEGADSFGGTFSEAGSILVNASSVTLIAGAGAGAASYAQIGNGGLQWGGGTAVASLTLGGDIDVDAPGGVIQLEGGDANDDYAQIGNGGLNAGNLNALGTATGNITVIGNVVALIAGSGGNAYAQIGLGGDDALFNMGSSTISVGASNGVSVEGAGNSVNNGDYAQIGDGGFLSAGGSAAGNITVTGDGVLVQAGLGLFDYAQIGDGGDQASGDYTGAISVISTGQVRLVGGNTDSDAYAQIGHGGDRSIGNDSGTITVSGTSVSVSGGTGSANADNYAQIGHGGWNADDGGDEAPGSFTGDISVTATAGTLVVMGGSGGQYNYAQIGHGGFGAYGAVSGNITATATGDVTVAANGDISYAQIGHGGLDFIPTSASMSGNILVSGDNITLQPGDAGNYSYAQIGFGGAQVSDEGLTYTGTVTVNATGTIMMVAESGAFYYNYTQIGHGGIFSDFSASGDISVTASGGITLEGGGGGNGDYAQIGHGGAYSDQDGGTGVSYLGDITVSGDGVTLEGGTGFASYAQIGHGGDGMGEDTTGTLLTGDISVTASGGTLSLVGGSNGQSYAQIGSGGFQLGSNADQPSAIGTITVSGATISLMGGTGNGTDSYAQIGHGGAQAVLDADADNITITTNGALTLAGGSIEGVDGDYAQIGNGGFEFTGDTSGAIAITAASISLTAGAGIDGYAQIGHGGDGEIGNANGTITITMSGALTLNANADGSASTSYAQIGNGGFIAVGSFGGNITIGQPSSVTLTAGTGQDDYVQIGNGGDEANNAEFDVPVVAPSYEINGNIGITTGSGGSVVLNAGGGDDDYAQIGNGGIEAFESASATEGGIDTSGNITVTANSVAVNGGGGFGAYAQIGNGGAFENDDATASTAITMGGNVTVSVFGSGGTLSVIGNSDSDSGSYAQIGNGDAIDGAEGAVSGDVNITVPSSGTTTMRSFEGSPAFIGDLTGSGTQTGSLSLTTGAFIGSGGALETSIENVIPFGTVTIDLTGTGTFNMSGELEYTSTFPLTLMAPSGTLNLAGDVMNDSSGAIVISGNTIDLSGTLTTISGPISLTGPVILTGDGDVDTTGGEGGSANITFSGTINDASEAAGSGGLTLAAGPSGTITFQAALGNSSPITFFNVTSAGAVVLSGNITTDGDFISFQSSPLRLAADVTLSTTGGSVEDGEPYIFFDENSPIDSQGGAHALTLNAGQQNVEFDGDVGLNSALSAFSATGGSIDVGGDVITNGGPVSLTTAPGNSGSEGAQDGSITVHGNIMTSGGSVTIAAVGNPAFEDDTDPDVDLEAQIATSGGAVTISATGIDPEVFMPGSISAGAGNISITANGTDSATLDLEGAIQTTSGSITLLASSTGEDDAEIFLVNASLSSTTSSGAISITATGSTDQAQIFYESTSITTAGAPVSFTATGAAQGYVEIDSGITTGAGNISVSATGTSDQGQVFVSSGVNIDTTSGTVTMGALGFNALNTLEGNIATGSGNVNLSATGTGAEAAGELALSEGSSVTTAAGSVALSARGDSASIEVDGTIVTGTGSVSGTSAAFGNGAGEEESSSEFFLDQGITTAGGSVSLSSTSNVFAEMILDAPIMTGGGSIALFTNDSIMVLDSQLVTGGGNLSAIAEGANSIMTVDCECGTPVATGGGTITLEAEGAGGSIQVFDPLTLSGPTNLVAQGGIDLGGGVSGSFPLNVYTDGSVVGVPNGFPFTLASYNSFFAPSVPPNNPTGSSGSDSIINPPPPTQPTVEPTDNTVTPPTIVVIPLPGLGVEIITTDTSGGGGEGLTTVTDLDAGAGDFNMIETGSGGSGGGDNGQAVDPLFIIIPITAAQQAVPKTESSDSPLGGPGTHIFLSGHPYVSHNGVFGIGEPASMGGNRNLWFAPLGGP